MTATLHILSADRLRATLVHHAMNGTSREIRLAAIDCLESENRAENVPIIAEAYHRIWPSLPIIARLPDGIYPDDCAPASWAENLAMVAMTSAAAVAMVATAFWLN